jgi:hypothetical protein
MPVTIVTGQTTKGVPFRWFTNLKFSVGKLKFLWERSAHNIAESSKFLYRNKTINLSKHIPNLIFEYPVRAVSLEAVTTGGTCVKARGLRDRSLFSQRMVCHTLLMFSYNSNF